MFGTCGAAGGTSIREARTACAGRYAYRQDYEMHAGRAAGEEGGVLQLVSIARSSVIGQNANWSVVNNS